MLRISDAIKIAITKFKAKKARSVISTLLVSLVFFAACLFIFASDGFLVSLKQISLQGLNGKNLVFVANLQANIDYDNLPEEILKIAKEKYRQAKIKDESAENPVYFDSYYNKDRLKSDNKWAAEAINEYLNEHYPKTTREDFEKIIANYKIKNHYPKTDFNISDSRFGIYINGKENIDIYVKQNDTTSLAGYLSSLVLAKMDVEQIFSIDKSQLRHNEVPILVNYSQAYNIAGEKNRVRQTRADF